MAYYIFEVINEVGEEVGYGFLTDENISEEHKSKAIAVLDNLPPDTEETQGKIKKLEKDVNGNFYWAVKA